MTTTEPKTLEEILATLRKLRRSLRRREELAACIEALIRLQKLEELSK